MLGCHPHRRRVPTRLVHLQEPKEKKKVGRPIAYTGDPNDPSLTEAERRRVKRRIANRESARRVRQRRLQEVDSILVQVRP